MTDYAAEQQMELEALEAILMDDLQIYEGTRPDGWMGEDVQTYKIVIDPTEEGDEVDDEYEKRMELLFAHTPQYPDEAPCIKLRSVRGLSDAEIAEASACMEEQIQANLGMAMIYTLVTAAKEWLRGRASAEAPTDPDVEQRKAQEEMEAKRAAARAHGTPVTLETFAAWKAAFDAEMAAAKLKLADSSKDDSKAIKMTGKAWFLSQSAQVDTESGLFSEDEEDIEEVDEEFDEADLDYDDDDDEGMLDELLEQGQDGK